jgi:hypothetical protein
VVFVGIYGLAKVCELAQLATSRWRRMLAVFVIFGLTGVFVVEGIIALNRRSAARQSAHVEQSGPAEPRSAAR